MYLAIDEARKELGAPSLQVSVIVDGDKEWNGSVGWSKPRDKETAKLNDLYHIGSVSKIYTSTLTMKLIEEGYLSLDDPVSMYVEDIPNGDKIKIRHLLNHTSGLYNYTEDRMFTFKTIFQKEWTIDDMLDIARQNEPLFKPGTDHYYSNTNYVLLM